MKRIKYFRYLFMGVCLIFLICPDLCRAAPKEPSPVLRSAQIYITEDAGQLAAVKEDVVVSDTDLIKNNKFEFTLSRINDTDIRDLSITVNGRKAEPVMQAGKALVKLYVPYDNSAKEAVVEASYNIQLKPGTFEVPLLVPVYASTGAESVVTVDFTAPEGTYIYSNSFPVVPHMQEGNRENVQMANIPSYVKFEFSTEKEGFFNEFSVISYVVFLALVAIIVKWVQSEMRSEKKGA